MKKPQPIVFNLFSDRARAKQSRPLRIEISSARELQVRVVARQSLPDGRILAEEAGTDWPTPAPAPAAAARPTPEPVAPAPVPTQAQLPLALPDKPAPPKPNRVGRAMRPLIDRLALLAARLDQARLPLALFIAALGVYLLVRLIGLTTFPAYFSFDEATPTLLANDFLQNGFRNASGELFPAFFINIDKFSLGTTVYLQLLPLLLYGRSEYAVRAVSVMAGMAGAAAVGLSLRDVFGARLWWAATLILSFLPAWFVLSRTGYETPTMVSLYAVALYFYLLYRQRDPRFLYPSILFAALAFYAYAPGQFIVGVTGLLLVLVDLRYHWEKRSTVVKGLALTGLVALPYFRFLLAHPTDSGQYLKNLISYWFYDISPLEKMGWFIGQYAIRISPLYWFTPASGDTALDTVSYMMKGYGFLPLYIAPLLLWGLWLAIRNVRLGIYRTLLVAFLVAPSAAALVLSPSSITRELVMVIPVTMLTTLGLDDLLGRLGRRLEWKRPALVAIPVFLVLIAINFYTCWDAVTNGPAWFGTYTADQINYAYPLFYEINAEMAKASHIDLVLSPLWTMRPDVLSRFYLGDFYPVRIASVYDMAERKLPIDASTLFVVTPDELKFARQNPKFTNVQVVGSLAYPDGQPGFYFLRIHYVSGIDKIMAAEDAVRQIPVVKTVKLAGQQVRVTFSPINGGSIENLFDGDPNTFMRTLESNPAVIELDFPVAIKLGQIGIIHGESPIELRVLLYDSESDARPLSLSASFAPNGQLANIVRLAKTVIAKKIRFEVRDTSQGVPGSVHIWEITLK